MTMAQAQAELKKRGFDVGQPDGVYGPRTRAALINFQRAVGIVETGELDSNTIAALSK
jgi:peptidoglycan hydrolase-like protein with peptidoglycan-binding domain